MPCQILAKILCKTIGHGFPLSDLLALATDPPPPALGPTQPPLAYPVDSYVLNEVLKAGFTEPTPIQAQGWPMALLGRDLIGLAGVCTLVWGEWDQ